MHSAITGQIRPVAANGIMAIAETPRAASTIESVRNPGMRSSSGAEAKPPSAEPNIRSTRNALTMAVDRVVL